MSDQIKENINNKRFRRKLKSKHKAKLKRKRDKRNLKPQYHVTYKSSKVKLSAPKDFRFAYNREEVINYISKLEKSLNKNKSLLVILRDVEKIDLEAIVLLLGIMAEFNAKRLPFNGVFPTNQHVRKILENSGFLEQLFPNNNHNYQFGTQKGIYTHGKNVLDQDLSADIIADALKGVFGEKRRSQGAQRILVEAMKNTIQHAGKNRRRHWWLSVKVDRHNKRATFSFLDYGIGIFKSLRTKDEQDPGYNWLKKLTLGYNNSRILEKIMTGKLDHISRTRNAKHGTGLPGMKTALDNNYVSKFVIMSNNVYADIGENNYNLLNCDFNGTLIQFEIVESCTTFQL